MRGDEVAIIDNIATGKRENLNAAATLHEVDIRDAQAVRAAFAAAQPQVVFHLAAQADVRKSIDDPAFDASVNVLGTINLLEAARTSGATRFVNTSTGGGIYGEVGVYPTPRPRSRSRSPPTARASSAPRPTAAGHTGSTGWRP